MNVAKTSEAWITSSRQDFVGLHNVAKYCVYLKEAFDAILLTAEGLVEQHLKIFPETREQQATSSMLKYKMGLFRSVNLRLASLDRRVANTLSLVNNSWPLVLILGRLLIISIVFQSDIGTRQQSDAKRQ